MSYSVKNIFPCDECGLDVHGIHSHLPTPLEKEHIAMLAQFGWEIRYDDWVAWALVAGVYFSNKKLNFRTTGWGSSISKSIEQAFEIQRELAGFQQTLF